MEELSHIFQKPLDCGSVKLILHEVALATHSKQVQLRLDQTWDYHPQRNRVNAYFNKPGGVFYSRNTDSLEFTLECDMDSDKDRQLPKITKIIFRPSETNQEAETAYANQIIALIPKAEKIPWLGITHKETLIE